MRSKYAHDSKPEQAAWWARNAVPLSLLILVALLSLAMSGCAFSRPRSRSEHEEDRRQAEMRDVQFTVSGVPGVTPGEFGADPAVIRLPDGTRFEVPAGTLADFRSRVTSSEESAVRSRDLLERLSRTPWWVYGVGAGVVAAGAVAAWLLKSVTVFVASTVAGMLWVAVFVAVDRYPWVFLGLVVALFVAVAWLAYRALRHRRDGEATRRERDKLRRAFEVVIRAGEDLPPTIKASFTASVQRMAIAAGIETDVKAVVSEVKRGGRHA